MVEKSDCTNGVVASPIEAAKTCGPKPSDCLQEHVAYCQATGVNVYKCSKCGSEEWL